MYNGAQAGSLSLQSVVLHVCHVQVLPQFCTLRFQGSMHLVKRAWRADSAAHSPPPRLWRCAVIPSMVSCLRVRTRRADSRLPARRFMQLRSADVMWGASGSPAIRSSVFPPFSISCLDLQIRYLTQVDRVAFHICSSKLKDRSAES